MPVSVRNRGPVLLNGHFPTDQNGGRLNVRRVLILLGVALLAFFIIVQPGQAANSVNSIGDSLYEGASSVTQFFSGVVNG